MRAVEDRAPDTGVRREGAMRSGGESVVRTR